MLDRGVVMDGRLWVELYEDRGGEWRWRLKSANGQIVAHGESYTRYRDAAAAATGMVGAIKRMDVDIRVLTAEECPEGRWVYVPESASAIAPDSVSDAGVWRVGEFAGASPSSEVTVTGWVAAPDDEAPTLDIEEPPKPTAKRTKRKGGR